MSMEMHYWSYAEDKYCCDVFRDTYMRSYWDFEEINWVVNKISNKYPSIKKSSIKMKLQNIKQICLKYKIKEISTIQPMVNYSQQNLLAMKNSLKEIGIEING